VGVWRILEVESRVWRGSECSQKGYASRYVGVRTETGTAPDIFQCVCVRFIPDTGYVSCAGPD
jgi:hypothetical protein